MPKYYGQDCSVILQFFKCYETTKISPFMYDLYYPIKTHFSQKILFSCTAVTISSHRKCSIKKVLLKTFWNFTRKHLCWSLFLIKLQGWRFVNLLKKTSTQVFSCGIFENFKNTQFEEHLPTGKNASEK